MSQVLAKWLIATGRELGKFAAAGGLPLRQQTGGTGVAERGGGKCRANAIIPLEGGIRRYTLELGTFKDRESALVASGLAWSAIHNSSSFRDEVRLRWLEARASCEADPSGAIAAVDKLRGQLASVTPVYLPLPLEPQPQPLVQPAANLVGSTGRKRNRPKDNCPNLA